MWQADWSMACDRADIIFVVNVSLNVGTLTMTGWIDDFAHDPGSNPSAQDKTTVSQRSLTQ